MATVSLTYTTKKYIPIATGCCESVYVCLKNTVTQYVVSGKPLILATIQNSGRYLGSAGRAFPPSFENPRCAEEYQYTLSYDDTQFVVDQDTGLPYALSCDEICEIMPYACTVSTLLADSILGCEDVLACINIADPLTGAGTEASPFGVDLSIDDTLTGAGTVASPLGVDLSTDICQDIVLGTDSKIYVANYDNRSIEVTDTGAVPVDISAANTYLISTIPQISIDNSTGCRDLDVLLTCDVYLQATLLDTGVWQVVVDESIDGGGAATIASQTYGPYTASAGTLSLGMPLGYSLSTVHTVAAGATLTIDRTVQVITTVPSAATSSVSAWASSIRGIIVAGI